MTTPAPDSSSRALGAVANAAADGLAPRATAAASRVSDHVAVLIRNNPARPAGIPSRKDVVLLHDRVPAAFASRVLADATAAFRAGWALGRGSLPVPATPPPDSPALVLVRADATRVAEDLRRDLVSALDTALADPGPSLPTPGSSPAPLLLARHRAALYRSLVDKAGRRAAVRCRALAAHAVPAGRTAAVLAHGATLAADPDGPEPVKTWVVTSAEPCPACLALDGVSLPLSAAFDPTATTDPSHRPPGAYGPLQGPPRHPWCRCRLRISRPGPASPSAAPSPPSPMVTATPRDSVSAAEVRAMPAGVFRTIRAFLAALAAGVSRLGRRRG